MSDSNSETESRKTSRCRKNSPSSIEEVSSGGTSSGEGGLLKKGPWTAAEDAILLDYVKSRGEGNWNAVQKQSGLFRCGKSCRLRWANHLRPDLKKGAFTKEEEDLIVELHAKMGNKWARMAAELPGRTDNEIKNYWNTRSKRLSRAGLPIYPDDVRALVLNESQQSQDMGPCRTGEKRRSDASQSNSFHIPDIEFKNLELNHLSCSPALFDIPSSSILCGGVNPSHAFGFMFPASHPHKRLREIETTVHSQAGSASNPFLQFDQFEDDAIGKFDQSLWPSSPYDDLSINNSSRVDLFNGSHAPINGNSCSSEPILVAMKSELPSLQHPEILGSSWGQPFSPLPSLESVDTLIQSPPSEQTQSDCRSPQNNGLLEAIVYGSQSSKNAKNKSYPHISETSVMAVDLVEPSSHTFGVCGDPPSPHSQSGGSVFMHCTPVSGRSLDEPQSTETIPGIEIKPEALDWAQAESYGKRHLPLEQLRPDILLDSFYVVNRTDLIKDQSLTENVGQLLDDDLSCAIKQVGALPTGSNQSCGIGASAWDMTAYQSLEDHRVHF